MLGCLISQSVSVNRPVFEVIFFFLMNRKSLLAVWRNKVMGLQ